MKKGILILIAMLGSWCMTQAVPAKRGYVEVVQSDGTTLLVETVGDEHFHCFVTQDGLSLTRMSNGDFHYLTPSGASPMSAHNIEQRTADERNYVESMRQMITPEVVRKTHTSRRTIGDNRKPQIPSLGSPRIPILLVGFSDIQMKHTIDDFKKQFHSGDKSVLSYYIDQSNGMYTPQFDLYGIYNVSHERAYYGNDSIIKDYYLHEMMIEAIDMSDDEVDWSMYDNDGDGEVDVCIFLYAGVSQAQASLTAPDAIWPCQGNFDRRADYDIGDGHFYRDEMKINRYAVFSELNGDSDAGTIMDGIGTFLHEYSHCLGLPDWYPTNGSGYFGMDYWSLMDQGCYNGTVIAGDTPIGYNSYEKNFLGWLDFIIPEENTRYNLPVFNQGNDQAIKIVSPLNENEYFILENRAQQGWDIHIPDEGVLVTHFTYIPERWIDNTPNNEEIQLGTIVPADGATSDFNIKTDLFGESNHALTDTSLPAAQLNMYADGTLADKAGGAGLLGKPITKIFLNEDKSATLWYMRANVPQVETPILAEASDITKTSFKASWEHNSNIDVTYTLTVNRYKKAIYHEQIKETFTHLSGSENNIANELDSYTQHQGWSGSNLYDGNGYLLMSTKNFPGKLTSPALDMTESDGKMTLKIVAASDGEGTNHKLTIKHGNSTESITLSDTQESYTIVIDCDSDNKQTVTLNSERNKRVRLYELTIYSGNASGVIDTDAESDETIIVPNITPKNYTVSNLVEGDTYTFMVQAIPVDISTADESEWSNMQSVTLGNSHINEMGNDTEPHATIIAYYDLSGRKLPQPIEGINIVRYSDGTSKKVVL